MVPGSDKLFEINSLMACAVFVSGMQLTKIQKMAKIIGLCIPSSRTYSTHVTQYVSPAVRLFHEKSKVSYTHTSHSIRNVKI